jgi:hypothetical protein
MGLAIRILVPWNETNRAHPLTIKCVNADGQDLTAANGTPLKVEGKLEVGRPVGIPPGTDIEAPLAINFPTTILPAGSYRWELEIDGEITATASFFVSG